MGTRTKKSAPHGAGLDRRALLRGSGVVVAASVAGVAMSGGEAQASTGQAVIAGQANNADTDQTSLTSSASTSTLDLGNSGDHAPLRLQTQVGSDFTPYTDGELENVDGDLYYTTWVDGWGPVPMLVYTEWTANQVIAITPQRVLDTRTAGGRGSIINPSGNLDSAGRLLGGHTIRIDLEDLEIAAASAFCNLTAVSPLGNGFMTLFPGGTRPATSSINFVKGAVVANFAVTGASVEDTVSIYSNATTHVLLDITALVVGSPAQINPDLLGASATAASRTRFVQRVRAGAVPTWYRGALAR